MACVSAAGVSSLFFAGRKISPGNSRRFGCFALDIASPVSQGRKMQRGIVAKAASNGSDSSSDSVIGIVQNAWSNSDDRLAIVGVGFASIAALWVSTSIFSFIDSLPIFPSVFQVIGVLFSSWFVYSYLLFKPDREEFWKNLKGSVADILGR